MVDRDKRLARRRKAVTGDVVPSVRRARPEVDEGPSDEDIERFGGVTQRCPECETELYDDVTVCWNCGHVLSSTRQPSASRWVTVIVVLIIIAIFIVWVL